MAAETDRRKTKKSNKDMKHKVHGVYQVILAIRLNQRTKT